jgi:hypothetical protein
VDYSLNIFGVWFIACGIKTYNPRVSLLQLRHLGIFNIKLFWDSSDNEILRIFRRHIEVHVVKIIGNDSLYFIIYIMWNLEFVNSPGICFKRVILEFLI